MKTTKAISTISYNTRHFLLGKLSDLLTNGFIDFYAVIKHKAEADEAKDHWHVYIEPAKAIDTLALGKMFTEIDPTNIKPLGCMPFRKSKFADWYWYGLHDEAYLLSKGESREHHYKASDVISSDDDFLGEMVRQNPKPCGEFQKVADLLSKGYNMFEIAIALNTPIRYLKNTLEGLNITINAMQNGLVYRNGHESHENGLEYNENGEINHEQDKRDIDGTCSFRN